VQLLETLRDQVLFTDPDSVRNQRDVKLERRFEKQKDAKKKRDQMAFARTFRAERANESDSELLSRSTKRRQGGDAFSVRQLRIAEQIEAALQSILFSDYKSHWPHAKLLRTVVEIDAVRMTIDLRMARVFWSAGDPKQRDDAHNALVETTPRLRHLVAQRVSLKYVPEFRFMDVEQVRCWSVYTIIHTFTFS
jgi:ribosome-binding factor A